MVKLEICGVIVEKLGEVEGMGGVGRGGIGEGGVVGEELKLGLVYVG